MIQWFPLHMHKSQLAIRKLMPEIHVIIELLDARIPNASSNPLLHNLTENKPYIRILNKSDLADPTINQQWLKNLQKENNYALLGCKDDKKQANRFMQLCKRLAPTRNSFEKPLRVMIIGIPNVGKSTLINQLLKRNAAKAMDIPATTKGIQCLTLADNFLLYDTPGITWPKFAEQTIGYNLALCNSIGRNAIDEEIIAIYLLNYLLLHYPQQLNLRYKLSLAITAATDRLVNKNHKQFSSALVNDIFRQIGSKRGCLIAHGKLDRQKTAELIINDFRKGSFGRISLEQAKPI